MREKIIEPGIEHELVAAERTALRLQLVEEQRAITAAARGLVRDQIVDIEEFAVDKVFSDAIAGQRSRFSLAPQRDNADWRRQRAMNSSCDFRCGRNCRISS